MLSRADMAQEEDHVEVVIELAPDGDRARVIRWLQDHGLDTLPLVVAGGLTAANVALAIDLLRPAVVDVSSGVELSPGLKDPAAVPAFVAAARGQSL